MKCRQVRKYVGAFADDELDVERNLEVLEHLNMCPDCAQRAVDIPTLKRALRRIWPDGPVPQPLLHRVRAALPAEGDSEPIESAPRSPKAKPEPMHRLKAGLRRFRLTVPLAMAASLALAVTVGRLWPSPNPQPGTATLVTARAASDIRKQHQHCVTHRCLRHHDQSLSRELPVIARRLSERLGLAVMVPDLAAQGFELVGADRCGIQGRPGAHVLYQTPSDGVMLSAFTTGRMAELRPDGLTNIGDRRYFVGTKDDLAVVAWHAQAETYVLCGPIRNSRLLAIAGQIRTASLDPRPSGSIRLASALHPSG